MHAARAALTVAVAACAPGYPAGPPPALPAVGAIYQASFSPDGQQIITASADGVARVWNALTGKLLVKVEHHRGVPCRAWFSPNGHQIFTVGEDSTARIWGAVDGKLLATLVGHTGAGAHIAARDMPTNAVAQRR